MRILLLSTYELGHQPYAVAAARAYLESAGHETRATDLSVSAWPEADIAWSEVVAVSVPMHTALRLGLAAVERLRRGRPEMRVAFFGLYAPVAAGNPLLRAGDLLVAGLPGPSLVEWLAGDSPSCEPVDRALRPAGGALSVTDLGAPPRASAGAPAGASRPLRPLRSGLEALDRYATLIAGPQRRLVGSTAASHGCNHRCKHCPVAAVYRGRSRPVPVEDVLEDAAQLVEAGARHLSLADPDFLNRPRHAVSVAEALHASWPELTFDATVKVEHVLRHEGLWPSLARLGLGFVLSAFESRDDEVLCILDKGHDAAGEAAALRIVRSAGIELRPSWLPFTPWTTRRSIAELLTFSAEHDLIWSTDAVQYSIRLLLPVGSLLLESPDPALATSLGRLDAASGSVPWRSTDSLLDALQEDLAGLAETALAESLSPEESFGAIWRAARRRGIELPPEVPAVRFHAVMPGPERPHLSESWFCCAEPTGAQRVAVGLPAP